MRSEKYNKKDKIAEKYAKLAKKIKTYPSLGDLNSKLQIDRNMIRHYFGHMGGLTEYAKENFPEYLEGLISPENFSDEVFDDLKEKAKKHKRFIITTAVAGAPTHTKFLASIKKYAKLKNAMVLIIPANYALYDMDPELVSDPEINIVFKTLKLNTNISVNPIKIDPKQIDPATSLDAFGQHETVIVGSPKQRRAPVANSSSKFARVIQATGAVTKPYYVPSDGMPKRRDTLAEIHHKMGAIIVEVENDKLYHFRNVEMSKDGSFNDLFYNYSASGSKYVGAEAIVQGDKHVGETDPLVNKAVDEMCQLGKPNYRIEHDFFNGMSINPHTELDLVTKSKLAEKGELSLEKELKMCAEEILRVKKLKTAKAHVIVESNHNDWIMQYLKKGNFSDNNRLIATKLQVAAIEGKHPFKAAMELMGVQEGPDLIFLDINDDFEKAGCTLGAHGHLGANGRRNPGTKGMYKAYGKCFFGHGHHGEIYLDAMMVGTSTYRVLDYNKGASSWDNSQGILYKDGTRQLVNVINGKWRL